MARQSLLLSIAAGLTAAGAAAGYATASRRLQTRLAGLEVRLRTDALTGAANRTGLMADLERRSAGAGDFVVALLDLDRFKQVNDRLGHAAGDQVLIDVVQRLRAVVDGVDGLVARLGGDELVVAAESPSAEVSHVLGTDIVLAASEFFPHTGDDLWVSASVGLVHALPGDDPRQLLATADHLMYQAKLAGGAQVAEQDLAYELDEIAERPAFRSRDLLNGHYELAVTTRRAD
jgi:diguanylate cyclase (GGDEF)-like protein